MPVPSPCHRDTPHRPRAHTAKARNSCPAPHPRCRCDSCTSSAGPWPAETQSTSKARSLRSATNRHIGHRARPGRSGHRLRSLDQIRATAAAAIRCVSARAEISAGQSFISMRKPVRQMECHPAIPPPPPLRADRQRPVRATSPAPKPLSSGHVDEAESARPRCPTLVQVFLPSSRARPRRFIVPRLRPARSRTGRARRATARNGSSLWT